MPLKLGGRFLDRSREVKKRGPRLKVCQLYRHYSLIEEILKQLCPEIKYIMLRQTEFKRIRTLRLPFKFALGQRKVAAYERFRLLIMRLWLENLIFIFGWRIACYSPEKTDVSPRSSPLGDVLSGEERGKMAVFAGYAYDRWCLSLSLFFLRKTGRNRKSIAYIWLMVLGLL